MQDDADAEAVARIQELDGQLEDQATRARRDSQLATAAARRMHQRTASAHERAMVAKRRELAAHARAIELHERAAALQERLGHSDRAANARQHAEHARELQERALEEQTAQEAAATRGGGHRAG
jgi:hypothetical protein